MTTMHRLPKSGNDWSEDDLSAYSVKIEYQDAQKFFGETPLPTPSVDQDTLTAVTADDATSSEAQNFMEHIGVVMDPIVAAEIYDMGKSPIFFLLMDLFRSLGYFPGPPSRFPSERQTLPFLNGGQTMDVRVDAHLFRTDADANKKIVLVVHEDMSEGADPNSSARLFAEAVAAFQYNNAQRRMVGFSELDKQVIIGIIMVLTSPSFFKIPITQELVRGIESGQPTSTPTTVIGFVPEVPHSNRKKDGMRPLDNRRIIFQCFEALKKLIR
ncbi:hypothetical protein BDN70DRAFT_291086 [Pholiota conissans]|uniref:Uncharacterized protein n=1 Tax=Pholiota conissans TaxID=109636 RepID=A0A9P5ZCS4_9AGAR|nr:hypothetical protein BDN70DRAFT_291086 [Pholiota conissans]